MTDTYFLLGNLLTFKARNANTGMFSLVEAKTAPGAGAPPNRHPGDNEAFYVVSGRYEFVLEGKKRICGPGEFVAIANGAVHSFTNVGDGVATLLILNWPGLPHEGFFTTVGEPQPQGTTELPIAPKPVDIASVVEVGRQYGITFPEIPS